MNDMNEMQQTHRNFSSNTFRNVSPYAVVDRGLCGMALQLGSVMGCDDDFVPPKFLRSINNLKKYDASIGFIYFLLRGRSIVYVGRTISLDARMQRHFSHYHIDRAFYVEVPVSKMNEIESALIRTIKPKMNCTRDTSPDPTDRHLSLLIDIGLVLKSEKPYET
jgi:hypothetical protein